MYIFLLDLHNLFRWAVVIVGLVALVMAWAGAASRSGWTPQQNTVGRAFTILMDLQVLIGILLYLVFSPITTNALRDFGAAMQVDQTRFFLVEHMPLMLIALVLLHIGAARGRRKDSPMNAAVFYTLGLLLVAFAIPWWRPLLPGLA